MLRHHNETHLHIQEQYFKTFKVLADNEPRNGSCVSCVYRSYN